MTTRYQLRTSDFGPISTADVELRPLTVLVGPSNTGKSYFAALLYALHRAVRPLGDGPFYGVGPGGGLWRTTVRYALVPHRDGLPKVGGELGEAVLAWLAGIEGSGSVGAPPGLPAYIHETLYKAFDINRALTDEVARCFGVDDPKMLVRRGCDRPRPFLQLVVPQGSDDARLRTGIGFDAGPALVNTGMARMRFPSHRLGPLRNQARFLLEMSDEERNVGLETLLDALATHAFGSAFGPVVRNNAYYLPADRTGVMHSHHVVVSTLLQRASLAGIRRFDDVPMLSGVMADFLDILVSQISQLERHPRSGGGSLALAAALAGAPQAATPDLASGIEKRVLNGQVLVNTGDVGCPAFSYRPSGWEHDLPLMRASSMVSELAPIVLYLRHVVGPGDLLIIEEPESHLHPAKQTALARELAAVVNAGVRVVMTTHSEWFLEQIGNLVRSSELPPDKRDSSAEVLQSEDVGAWLFQDAGDGKGSSVSEIKVDPETGLFPTDFGPVSDALYNEHAAIFNALEREADE